METTTIAGDSLSAYVDAAKDQLRELISQWSNDYPDQILVRFERSRITALQIDDEHLRSEVLRRIDGYTGGSTPPTGPTPIAHPYRFVVLPVSDVIEVLLITEELLEGLDGSHLQKLAAETARVVQEHAQKAVDVDDVFAYFLPVSIHEWIKDWRSPIKSRFRSVLETELETRGLTINSGAISGELQIRRNR